MLMMLCDFTQDPSLRGSQGELTNNYIRSMRLLQNTSRCAWVCVGLSVGVGAGFSVYGWGWVGGGGVECV